MSIKVSQIPQEGEVIPVMTANLPALNSQVEFIKGKEAVAIGVVVEHMSRNAYKVLVVMSETGGKQ